MHYTHIWPYDHPNPDHGFPYRQQSEALLEVVSNYNTPQYSTSNYSTPHYCTSNGITPNYNTPHYGTFNYTTPHCSTSNYSTLLRMGPACGLGYGKDEQPLDKTTRAAGKHCRDGFYKGF